MTKMKSDFSYVKKIVDLGADGSFTVHVRRPSWGQLVADMERATGFIGDRIKAAIVGWEGLTEDAPPDDPHRERELPFSEENLERLCVQFPMAFSRLSILANEAFRGLSADEEKKPDVKPLDLSADAAIAAMPGKFGSGSEGPGDSAENLKSAEQS